MRVLFLLLLLANLLFVAWTRWVVAPAPVAREVATTQGDLQPITLQREVPAATGAAAGASGGVPGTDLLAASCVSVGPFGNPAHAATAAARLERLGFTSRRRVALDEVRVGSWVRVPNLATPVDATNALAVLQAAGLGDAAIVADGEPANTISIGVYADPRRAEEVAAAVAQAGFTPEISDRLRELEVLWLDIDRRDNGGLPALEALGSPPEGGLPYDFRACPVRSEAAGVTPAANPSSPPAGDPASG